MEPLAAWPGRGLPVKVHAVASESRHPRFDVRYRNKLALMQNNSLCPAQEPPPFECTAGDNHQYEQNKGDGNHGIKTPDLSLTSRFRRFNRIGHCTCCLFQPIRATQKSKA